MNCDTVIILIWHFYFCFIFVPIAFCIFVHVCGTAFDSVLALVWDWNLSQKLLDILSTFPDLKSIFCLFLASIKCLSIPHACPKVYFDFYLVCNPFCLFFILCLYFGCIFGWITILFAYFVLISLICYLLHLWRLQNLIISCKLGWLG